MKKLITLLSAVTITTTIAPTIVACGQKKELDLNSLTADSFKQLDIIDGISINTKNINEISDDQKLIDAIKSHIKVMTLKKVFDLTSIVITWNEKERNRLDAFNFFWDSAKPAILNIKVDILEENKKYEVTIKKEKWENIKIDVSSNKDASSIVKAYYDHILIKREVKITITK